MTCFDYSLASQKELGQKKLLGEPSHGQGPPPSPAQPRVGAEPAQIKSGIKKCSREELFELQLDADFWALSSIGPGLDWPDPEPEGLSGYYKGNWIVLEEPAQTKSPPKKWFGRWKDVESPEWDGMAETWLTEEPVPGRYFKNKDGRIWYCHTSPFIMRNKVKLTNLGKSKCLKRYGRRLRELLWE